MTVKHVSPNFPPPDVQITMTQKEAAILRRVCGSITGEVHGPRETTTNLWRKLGTLGLPGGPIRLTGSLQLEAVE